jgi:hypothetical protein
VAGDTAGEDREERRPIDAGLVVEPNPDVETAMIGAEALLFDPLGPFRTPLNPTAALVWASLDGVTPLGEIAEELATATGAPPDVVLPDVISVVAHLLTGGIVFVSGIPHPPSERPPRPAPPLAADFPPGEMGGLSVRLGDDHAVVDMRCNDAGMSALLHDAVAPSLVPSIVHERAEQSVSLLVGADRGRIPGMCHLYRDREPVFSTSSRGRALRAALGVLDGFLPPPPGTLRLDARVLVGRKGATLVSGPYREVLDGAGRRLGRAGWQRVDGAATFVDRESIEVLRSGTRFPVDTGGLVRIDEAFPPEYGERARPGRQAVRHVVLVGSAADEEKLVSAAQRVAALLPLLWNLGEPIDPGDVEWLARLDERATVHWVRADDDAELLDLLDRLGDRVPRPRGAVPR